MADRSTLEVLERALYADPDDLAAHQAYADVLVESGDLRGEFIQVQLALEDAERLAEERQRLAAQKAELLRLHQREWLGEDLCSLLDAPGVHAGFLFLVTKKGCQRMHRLARSRHALA